MGSCRLDRRLHVCCPVRSRSRAAAGGIGPERDVVFALEAVISLVLRAWRRARWLQRIVLSETDNSSPRLEELESRIADLEAQHGRVLELEERVDFTERMLANQRALSPASLSPELLPKRGQGS